MKHTIKNILPLTAVVCLFMAAPNAIKAATIVYTLNTSGCSSGCGVLPAGTVKLTDGIAGTVGVEVQLAADYSFRSAGRGDPNHAAFAFNSTVSSVTISNISSGDTQSQTFVDDGAISNDSPFGAFEYSLKCTSCSTGVPAAPTRYLSFAVTKTGLTTSSFAELSTNGSPNAYFAADVVGLTSLAVIGETGNIGATSPGVNQNTTTVPEPGGIASFISTLGAVGCGLFLARKRLSA